MISCCFCGTEMIDRAMGCLACRKCPSCNIGVCENIQEDNRWSLHSGGVLEFTPEEIIRMKKLEPFQ